MDNQKDIFLSEEADEWFIRNKHTYQTQEKVKPLIDLFLDLEIKPINLLEIGCANGSRLHEIYSKYKCNCSGLDPSNLAIQEGKEKFRELDLKLGTAENLPFNENQFDVIIFGFCLYLCDRKDLFKIACEADRCLKDGGYMFIKDFLPPFAYKNTYVHKKGIFSYKMDYSKMFDWNPTYQRIFQLVTSHSGSEMRSIPNEKIGITVLQKNENSAYIKDPF